jgi:dGTPase
LRLNEDLVEAIGLGHDLGHPPFGHIGEDVLDRCAQEKFGRRFFHNEHSLRIVEHLERNGEGLNLTESVRDGILCHSSRAQIPRTLEGKIVRLVDRVAYINHDIDDAVRAGILEHSQLPAEEIAILGNTSPERIDTLVNDLVENSERAGDIVQGEEIGGAMTRLRSFMFSDVYLGDAARQEHDRVGRVLRDLFAWYCDHPEELPTVGVGSAAGGGDLAERVIDYIAGMTDRFAIRTWSELVVPRGLELLD